MRTLVSDSQDATRGPPDSEDHEELTNPTPPTSGYQSQQRSGERGGVRRRSKSMNAGGRSAVGRESHSTHGSRTFDDDPTDADDGKRDDRGGGGDFGDRGSDRTGSSWFREQLRLADIREGQSASERRSLKAEVERLKKQADWDNESLKEHRITNSKLEKALKTAVDRLKDSQQKMGKMQEAMPHLEREMGKLREEATRLKYLDEESSRLEHELLGAEYKVAKLNREVILLDHEAAQLRQENTRLQHVDKEASQLKREVEELRRAKEMLGQLQKEVLAGVDRHEPAFDEAVQAAFVAVNGKINALVKFSSPVYKAAAAVPFDQWGVGAAMWAGAYNPDSPAVRAREQRVIKQLLRLVVWHFLSKTLLDRARPFACFGSSLARRLDEDYRDVFDDFGELVRDQARWSAQVTNQKLTCPPTETSEAAAKWRTMTAARLLEMDNDEYKTRVLDNLLLQFASLMYDHMGFNGMPLEKLEETLRGEALKKLGPVLKAALALAQLVVKERAGFSLEIPDLTGLGFHKEENDALMTTRGASLNIDVGGGKEEEGGVVALVASPMLIKWGTGSGQQLTSKVVLQRAFVEVVPAPEPVQDLAGWARELSSKVGW